MRDWRACRRDGRDIVGIQTHTVDEERSRREDAAFLDDGNAAATA